MLSSRLCSVNPLPSGTFAGMRVAESQLGVIASDPDAYKVFAALFTPIIAHVHGFHDRCDEMVQPTTHFGDPNNPDLDLSKADLDGLILSTRVRVGRNLDGFAFPSFISNQVEYYNAFNIYLFS